VVTMTKTKKKNWEYFVSKIHYVGVLNRNCLWTDSAGRSLVVPQEESGVSKEAMANFLNILGKQGWELVAVHEGHYVFKRPKAAG
jgi:hypothetical protein